MKKVFEFLFFLNVWGPQNICAGDLIHPQELQRKATICVDILRRIDRVDILSESGRTSRPSASLIIWRNLGSGLIDISDLTSLDPDISWSQLDMLSPRIDELAVTADRLMTELNLPLEDPSPELPGYLRSATNTLVIDGGQWPREDSRMNAFKHHIVWGPISPVSFDELSMDQVIDHLSRLKSFAKARPHEFLKLAMDSIKDLTAFDAVGLSGNNFQTLSAMMWISKIFDSASANIWKALEAKLDFYIDHPGRSVDRDFTFQFIWQLLFLTPAANEYLENAVERMIQSSNEEIQIYGFLYKITAGSKIHPDLTKLPVAPFDIHKNIGRWFFILNAHSSFHGRRAFAPALYARMITLGVAPSSLDSLFASFTRYKKAVEARKGTYATLISRITNRYSDALEVLERR